MAYKILTKNGIDNTNIDGARDNYFNAGMRDGIVQGVLNEGLFTATASNVISLDTCELRIAGHRIVIDEPVYHTFTNAPSTDTRYAFIAQVIVDDNQNVDFSLFVQTANTPLIQNDLYKNITGAGTYQVEIGRFTLLTTLEVVDVTKTIETITGADGIDGDYIRIGEVTTTMLEAGFDAEVDVENVVNQATGLKETNFHFNIPKTAGSVVNVDGQQVESVNFTSDPQTQLNNLNSNKVEKIEGKGLSTNDYTTAEKNKLAGIETGAQVNKPIDSEFSTTSENSLQNKTITQKFNNLFNEIYPIGSIYISTNNTSPASLFGGTWESLSENFTLWTTTTSGQGGQTIEAGLPNITGDTQDSVYHGGWADNTNGAFSADFVSKTIASIGSGSSYGRVHSSFDASQSNAIYGNSDTVQPPAIKVYMWKRVD